MTDNFFTYLLYLFYGLAFFTMGIAVMTANTRHSKLKVARLLWLFVMFAFIHAVNEWLELYLQLEKESLSIQAFTLLFALKLALKFVSYLFLLAFGLRLIVAVEPRLRLLLLVMPAALLVIWLTSLGFREISWQLDFLRLVDLRGRNIFGFPSAITAGLGFLLYARSLASVSNRAAKGFVGAGLGLLAYAVLTGLIPSATPVSFGLVAVQVEILRGSATLVILYFLMTALHVFEVEQRTLLEERLNRYAQSEKLNAIGKLAAGIAHELNNPLTNISLNVELLRNDLKAQVEPARLEKRFAFIERNIERASHIARELLSFSRKDEAAFIEVDINRALQSTLTLLGARRHEFRFILDTRPIPLVRAVPWKLEEVFLNIIINAMDASSPGNVIMLSTSMDKEDVVVRISDRGCGIPADNLNQVVEPFFTTKDVGQGTGLGLSVCYGIMSLHRGRMSIDSEVNKGTTVSLYFPPTKGKEHAENTCD